MKLSTYILLLQSIQNEHGDLDVDSLSVSFDRKEAKIPEIAYRKILKGRESKPSFWSSYSKEDCKGEKVVKVQ